MCPKCGSWLFPEEFNTEKDSPPKLFIDLITLLSDIIEDELQIRDGIKNRLYKKRIKGLKKRSGMLVWR